MVAILAAHGFIVMEYCLGKAHGSDEETASISSIVLPLQLAGWLGVTLSFLRWSFRVSNQEVSSQQAAEYTAQI